MSVDGFSFVVESPWSVNEGRQLTDVICVADARDPGERSEEFDGEIHHEITECNVIHLTKSDEEEDDGCTFTIKMKTSEWKITKVSIVSEVRIIELYGPHGEYLSTIKGLLLCGSDGVPLYNAQPDVNTRFELTIKFPGVTNSVWIYGVKLLVQRSEHPTTSERFDYSHIDEMLKSSKFPITETADQAKQFLQKYSSFFNGGKAPTMSTDPKALLKMLETEYKSHLKPMEEAGNNMTQYVANLMQKTEKKKDEEAELVTEMKAYVDESVRKLEERVENNLKIQLEALEAKQSQKLDLILQMLASK